MNLSDLKTGYRVRHVSRDECGTVTILPNGNAQVIFDNPTPGGRVSIGEYDENWFKIYPNGLELVEGKDDPRHD